MLKKARKARGNKKKKIPKIPEQLKIGDNVLVRDLTLKAFQPKYNSEERQDSRTILFQGSKLEEQHTSKI